MDAVRRFGALVGTALFAGSLAASAGGASQPAGATPAFSRDVFSASFVPSASRRRARIFVSDAGDETVDILTYAGGSVHQITGLSEPQGLCTDRSTVWVANTGGSNLVRYSASGVQLAVLADAGQFPVGCSVDRAGDVAAANIISTSSGPGSVSVWPNGGSSPANYAVPGMTRVYGIAYVPNGDLIVDGTNGGSTMSFAELVKGGSSFRPFTIEGATFTIPGSLQYAYRALAVGHYNALYASIYQVKVEGAHGRIVGSTRVPYGPFCISPFHTVIVIDPDGKLDVYAYPTGGYIRTFGGGFGLPIACAIVD
jgi:hypothetical protein